MPNLSNLPELFPPSVAEEAQRVIAHAKRTDIPPKGLRLLRMSRLLRECGGWPQGPGELPRSDADRVLEIRTQLERLAEVIAWDRDLAEAVLDGTVPAHVATMIMREERGYYRGEFGALRYQVDVWVQRRIDPTEDVSR
jgi:hypothetical protein